MNWSGFDEAVQSSKKRDNYNYLFYSKPTFRRFISFFFGVLKVNEIKCDISLSPQRQLQYYIILLLPLREETEGNIKLDLIHWPFKTLPEEGGNESPKRQFFWKKIVIIIPLFWTLDCLIKIHFNLIVDLFKSYIVQKTIS